MNVPLVHTHVLPMPLARTRLVRTLAIVTTVGLVMVINVLRTIPMSAQLVNIIAMSMLNVLIKTGGSSAVVTAVIVEMELLALLMTTHHLHQQRQQTHVPRVLVLLMPVVTEVAPMPGSLVHATRDTLVMEWDQWVATMMMSASVAIITVPLRKPVSI